MPALKLVLLGDLSVGKSSLVNRFAVDSFDPHLPNTIGAAFISKEHVSKDRSVKFEVWDTAGQERYKSLTPMYYRNAKVALVCFDLSNTDLSFHRARYWCDQLAVLGPPDIDIVIVGTKLDLAETAVDVLVPEFCSDRGLRYVATSAKLGQGVLELFDSIVDGLDEEMFRQLELEPTEPEQENVLLFARARNSGCC
ncbi:hypothetical protein METBIDRAFT_9342 [Metschnikowia bicuspidata var. bicuspidata NRRL YB-4993]|uniref:Ras-domain-containing protein n=1 Tax=Metschnikowia bicuspidata var. bicuspidata NRRL YB-4993 TaxID=869754 RepID=A0A1A0HG84_9ASCO|nr:hypothetical protein METBIDRAFT_9342 [Metschnikowia bicuspidata var. bicuspidata NRRL YB-4993]OBA23016.1 hypothetical protein METBIDRAFT_9342 [Metschnikowia bicuspidata var. bicuspidata NRRL YB-4993]